MNGNLHDKKDDVYVSSGDCLINRLTLHELLYTVPSTFFDFNIEGINLAGID